MQKFLIFLSASIIFSSAASAQNLFETTEDARLRHNAERYDQYQKNGNNAPLGGYKEKYGDSAPRGTDRPGYVTTPRRY